ncbi:MAG: WYL domain-containing protein, partial [Marinoscillum sp.]
FDENVDLKGMEYFGSLFNAILYKKTLRVAYKSFKADATQTHTISPYYLKQFNNRWFLLCQNASYSGLSNLSLDRIEDISESKEPYIPNNDYNFFEYFEDMIGVTKPPDASVVSVCLWFSVSQTPYIKTKPIHGTQHQTFHDDGSSTVTVEVLPNYELEQLILSYGENCKVLEPERLKKTIKDRLNKSLKVYHT